MDEWPALVKNAVSALVILIAISVVLFLTYLGLDAANASGEKIANTTTAMDMRAYDTYNQTTIKGSTVLSAVKNYQNQPIGVVVSTKSKNIINYNALLSTASSGSDPSHAAYVGAGDNEWGLAPAMNDEQSGLVLDGLAVYQEAQNLNTQTATDKSKQSYINPSANFNASLIFNLNGQVIGLYMEQVGVETSVFS